MRKHSLFDEPKPVRSRGGKRFGAGHAPGAVGGDRPRALRDSPAFFALLLVAALLLCALSAAIQQAPNRYVAAATLPGLAAAGELRQWRPSRAGASLVETAPRTVRLQSTGSREFVYVYRYLGRLDAAEYLRISAEVRGEGLEGGYIGGGAAQLVAMPFDKRNRRVAHWPSRVAGLEGDTGWRHVSLVVPTGGRLHALQLVAFVAGQSGWMEIRAPRVEAVSESPVFRLTRYAVMFGWALLALALVAWLLRPGPRRLPRAAFATFGGLAVFMALASPPLVEGSVKRLLVVGQDLLYDAADLLRSPPQAAPTEGHDDVRPAQTAASEAQEITEAAGSTDEAAPGDAADAGAEENASDAAARAVDGERLAADAAAPARQYWMPPRRNLDKRAHLAGFAALALLAAFAFTAVPVWWLLPPLFSMALAIEVLQGFTVMREPGLLDLLAGVAGVGCGLLLARLFAALVGRWRAFRTLGL